MNNKQDEKHFIELPEKVVESMELDNEDVLQLNLKDNALQVQNYNKKREESNIRVYWYMLPSIVIALGCLIATKIMKIEQLDFLAGNISIANAVTILGVISGFFTCLVSYIMAKKGRLKSQAKDIAWRSFPIILASFAIVTFFALLLVFRLLDSAFVGVSFDVYTGTFIICMLLCIVNYMSLYVMISISPRLVTSILVITIVGGVFVSMVTNKDLQWWQHNFSYLGTTEASAGWEFNITLIFSALLMIALVDYLFILLHKYYPKTRSLLVLRILLSLTAISLGCVGFFPNDEFSKFQRVHTSVAGMMVYLIIILIVGLKWFVPNIKKEFLKLSYIIGISLLVITVIFQATDYLSLTVFELVAFILAFAWLFLLFRYLENMIEEYDRVFYVTMSSTMSVANTKDVKQEECKEVIKEDKHEEA